MDLLLWLIVVYGCTFRYVDNVIMCYPLRRCNSNYQVHVMDCVPYVGWATCSRVIVTLNCPSIIRPNDENFLSGPSSVSRSFKLFQLASVWTSQKHVRMPHSVRSAMGFHSKTQIWEDSYNRSDDVDSHPNALIHKAFKIKTFGVKTKKINRQLSN